ncbi:MAG: hypothetical protein ACRC62_33970 [Microcoleus sp.]
MNSDNLSQMFKTGFHLTLGAASFAIETLQDPLKREENLAKLQSDLSLLADELLEKGEMTDREARNYVDTVFGKPSDPENSDNRENNDSEFASDNLSNSSDRPSDTRAEPQPAKPADTIPEPVARSNAQQEIQELTIQMAALRVQLENLRAEDSQRD